MNHSLRLLSLMGFCALSTAFINRPAQAAAGDLDPTFGSGGKVYTDVTPKYDFAHTVATQSDGKIVAAGGGLGDIVVTRYNTNGTLDTTFSGDGIQVTDLLADSFDASNDAVIQSDGKIVVAGSSNIGGYRRVSLVRYNTDGSLDTTFDSDGKVITTPAGPTENNYGYGVAQQSDGKIVVAGHRGNDILVLRYNTDGSLDTSFSGDGIVTTDLGGGDEGRDVAIQSDGKIVVAGTNTSDFALVRYNSDGTLDSSFNGGTVVTDIQGVSFELACGLALQSDGKIVAVGTSDNDFVVVRYNSNGTLDTSFSADGMDDGISVLDFGGYDSAYDAAVQPDGKIVAAGEANNSMVVVRFNSNGTIDNSFSGDGMQTVDFFADYNGAYGMTIQSDGKVIAAGETDLGSNGYIALFRLQSDTLASTPNSSANGSGYYSSRGSAGQASFSAAYNKNGLGGSLSYTDSLRKVSITSTQITSIAVEGNMARITGACKFNGVGGYNFVLTAYDYYSTFFGRGDSFLIEVNNEYTGGGAFTRGDVRVVAPVIRN